MGFSTVVSATAAHAAEPTNPAVVARPAPNAELDAQPDAVTVAFLSHPGDPAKIVVEDANGRSVASASPRVVSTNIIIQTDGDLGPGTYTVKYRVQGKDGPEGGSYQFAVGQGDFDAIGFSTWVGPAQMPKALALPQDSATGPTPSAGTDGGSDLGTGSASLPDGEAAAADSSDAATTTWWPWVLLAGAVAAVGAVVVVARRRRGADAVPPVED